MTANSITKDNLSENGINEQPLELTVIPKRLCNNLPAIKLMKTKKTAYGTTVVYGRDYDTICNVCGKSFREHEAISKVLRG